MFPRVVLTALVRNCSSLQSLVYWRAAATTARGRKVRRRSPSPHRYSLVVSTRLDLFVPRWKIRKKEKATRRLCRKAAIPVGTMKQQKKSPPPTTMKMKIIVQSNLTFAKSDTTVFSKRFLRMETWFYFCLNASYPYRKPMWNLWWGLHWFMKTLWECQI